MIGIILLVIPLGFLVIGIIYFSVTLWKLKSPIQEHSPQGITAISPKTEVAFSPMIGFLEKEITTLNSKILSDEDIEFLCYAIYIKSHDKVIEMHNIEMHLEKKKVITQEGPFLKMLPIAANEVITQEGPFLKMLPIAANEVVMTRSIRDLKSKEELLWVQN